MSDSGTVELSRDCGEEGTRHMPCHGKEDRNTILNELTCIDDTDNTDNTMKTSSDLLVDIHQKSVELIKAVPSDNKEDNNIDGVVIVDNVKGDSNLSDRVKLNLDDVMMGDQPMPTSDDKVELKSLSKEDKKPKKKADGDEKYLKKINKKKMEKDDSDELMMGDQPANDDTTVDSKPKEDTSSPTTMSSSTLFETSEAAVSSTTILSTTETRLRRETEISVNEAQSTDSSVFTTEPSAATSTTISPPIKISTKADIKSTPKPHVSDEHVSISHHQKDLQEVHSASDHFIPPMLLVRTQFSLSNGHGEHIEGPRKHIEDHEVTAAPSNDVMEKIKTSPSIHLTTAEATTVDVTTMMETTTPEVTTATIVSTTERNSQISDMATTEKTISEFPVSPIGVSTTRLDTSTTILASTTVSQIEETTKLPTTSEQIVTELKITTEIPLVPVTEPPRFRQPHAPKHSVEFHSKTPSPTTVLVVEASDATTLDLTTTSPSKQTTENVVTEHLESTVVTVTTSSPLLVDTTETSVRNNCSAGNLDNSSDKPIELAKRDHPKHHSNAGNVLHSDHNLNDHLAESAENEDPCWTEDNASADLSNSDVYQPYRPNRRRVLTKPESHSYIKKVLG